VTVCIGEGQPAVRRGQFLAFAMADLPYLTWNAVLVTFMKISWDRHKHGLEFGYSLFITALILTAIFAPNAGSIFRSPS